MDLEQRLREGRDRYRRRREAGIKTALIDLMGRTASDTFEIRSHGTGDPVWVTNDGIDVSRETLKAWVRREWVVKLSSRVDKAGHPPVLVERYEFALELLEGEQA